MIGCSIAYHLGRRGISARVVDRESIAVRASGKAWAVFTYAPTWVASERCTTGVSETQEGAAVDVSTTVPGVSVADWLLLHSASYDRMPELALELEDRGGVDIEWCETPSTDLVTRQELEDAGGPEGLLRPMRDAGGVEAAWIDGDALREVFPSPGPGLRGGIQAARPVRWSRTASASPWPRPPRSWGPSSSRERWWTSPRGAMRSAECGWRRASSSRPTRSCSPPVRGPERWPRGSAARSAVARSSANACARSCRPRCRSTRWGRTTSGSSPRRTAR